MKRNGEGICINNSFATGCFIYRSKLLPERHVIFRFWERSVLIADILSAVVNDLCVFFAIIDKNGRLLFCFLQKRSKYEPSKEIILYLCSHETNTI